jgi:tRNA (cytidine56-2'-O)-methyltransferase
MKVCVLRLGHRPLRDQRVTTHVALVSRAFGADELFLHPFDERIRETLEAVGERWGGSFPVQEVTSLQGFLRGWEGIVVHLTMYGLPLGEVIPEIRRRRKEKDLLIVVGSEKVPREIYDWADYNVSITQQPHSEVSALAVFLDHLFEGRAFSKEFQGRVRILPSPRSKKVLREGGKL